MNFITEFDGILRLKNPPKKLYYKGDLKLLKRPKISIVGSRKMSFYTKNLVFSLASRIKNSGGVVVSGGALGVDITAHSGALPSTIAVFANGLDEIYPKSNENIIRQIYANSLALSEYEPNDRPERWRFLERNQIVVALSKALIVAQADIKSGSMKSAEYALEMGVPLYVLPHRIDESLGTNYLLSSGKARLISDIDEFLKQMGLAENLEQTSQDELIKSLLAGLGFEELYAKFGDEIYEYELDGKIAISGNKIVIL